MVAIYPFGEWAIHVYLLHAKPIRIRGRKVETMAARAHRAHHSEPNDLDMVLLYWWQAAFLMLLAVPFTVGLGALLVTLIAGPVPLGALVTAGDRRLLHDLPLRVDPLPDPHRLPAADRVYKAIWRNHRLHHFKNEHFWHGVTNNLSDRVLGTNPGSARGARSRTRPARSPAE